MPFELIEELYQTLQVLELVLNVVVVVFLAMITRLLWKANDDR